MYEVRVRVRLWLFLQNISHFDGPRFDIHVFDVIARFDREPAKKLSRDTLWSTFPFAFAK